MSQHAKSSQVCLNCDEPLNEEYAYCPKCGQENHDLHVPLKHLLHELVEGVLHFDAKFLQSAKMLVFQPGSLTVEYNAGRRTRYVPPVRMYIFVSFLFFLLLSFHYHHAKTDESRSGDHANGKKTVTAKDFADTLRAGQKTAGAEAVGIVVDSSRASADDGESKAVIQLETPNDPDNAVVNYLNAKGKKLQTGGLNTFIATMFKTMSYLMFFLMPFAAFLVSLAFRSAGKYYIDHLVFSVHYHCFAFLLFSVYFLVYLLVPTGWLSAGVTVILLAYLFLSLRRVYGGRPAKMIVKTMLLTMSYSAVLVFTFVASILISIVML